MNNLFRLVRFVWNHPLNRSARFAALGRVIRWQLAARLMPGPIALPFVNGTYLFATRGMTGATGNWYCGLHEYEDMSFVLHTLKPDDLFVDVGANIGSYSILAAGGGSKVLAIEPIPSTFRALTRNIVLNEFEKQIEAMNIGLGSEPGNLQFSADQDTVNHVLAEGESARQIVHVPIRTLDDVLAGSEPSIIKIDVEGFETKVLEGAQKTLTNPTLRAVIMELNGSGERYGFDEEALLNSMLSFGFEACVYDPVGRQLVKKIFDYSENENIIFIRRLPFLGFE